MLKIKSGLWYGNEPTSIAEILGRYYDLLPPFRAALIRSLDSTRDPSGILEVLRRHGSEALLGSGSVVLSPDQLRKATANGVFVGFDEIWFSKASQFERIPPLEVFLTSDGLNMDEGLPEGMNALMEDLDCILAMGDGCGLNLITSDCTFAALIGDIAGE